MTFLRYVSHFTVGAAGLCTGLLFHEVSSNRRFSLGAADPIPLELDSVIASHVEPYVAQYSDVMKYGIPIYDTLRIQENFVLAYDRRLRVPHFVMEHLTPDMFGAKDGKKCGKRKNKYYEDGTIHQYFRSTRKDYSNSGYSKGHIAASANHKHSQRAMDQTNVLSNMAPQDRHCNGNIWCKLEDHVRWLTKEHGSVYVCSGPLYLPRILDVEKVEALLQQENQLSIPSTEMQWESTPETKNYVIYEVIGANHVAVPTHFFKVILYEPEEDVFEMEAYQIPNEPVDRERDLKDFKVARDVIERAAGFLVFHHLPSDAIKYINRDRADDS